MKPRSPIHKNIPWLSIPQLSIILQLHDNSDWIFNKNK